MQTGRQWEVKGFCEAAAALMCTFMLLDNYWLWHPLQQYWGNTKKTNELKRYVSGSIKEHRVTINPMWALMAELTPQPIDLLFRTNNLRKLADDVNKYVTRWFRDEWSNDVNIVATDFFLGNDLIDLAINVNKNKWVIFLLNNPFYYHTIFLYYFVQ